MTMAPSPVFQPTLPGRYCTDPAIFDAEQCSIFSRQWVYACRTQDVPSAGRFVRMAVGDENVLVVRGRDEVLRAFLNVCRHRDATLCAADSGEVGRYDLGSLVAGKRIDYTVAANWKIIQENFQECYHCSTIHPELVDTIPQFRDISKLPGYLADGYDFAPEKASFSVTGQALLPLLPGLAERDERRYYGMVLRPNCFLSLLPDHVIVHRFQPLAPDLTTVTCEWLFPPETIAAYDVADTVELFHLVNEQDFAATEACQPNMRSRAYAKGGILVPLEQEIIGRWYYDWYRTSMDLGESP